MAKVRDLFHDTEATKFVIVTIPALSSPSTNVKLMCSSGIGLRFSPICPSDYLCLHSSQIFLLALVTRFTA
nr:ATPase ASNA1 homolog [Ipomoea batatas]GMD04301.1 ATPase ASNA1 homolog [Ipomoea batatas]